MSTKRNQQSSKLEVIRKVVVKSENDGAQKLKALIDKKQQEEQRLIQLIGFRKEYENQQLKKDFDPAITIQHIQNHRKFIAQINQAIISQQGTILNVMKQIDRQIMFWTQSKVKKESLNNLIRHYQETHKKRELQREQRMQDDQGRLYAAGRFLSI